MTQAKSGDTVRIHYTGTLTDGTEFDSSRDREPLEFTIGTGSIIPGLEREIVGMAVGDTNTINVAADEAYGAHNPEAVQNVPRGAIPPEVQLVVGARLQAQTPDGQHLMLTVVEVTEEMVTLDANHPLAGKDLVFEVELVEIG